MKKCLLMTLLGLSTSLYAAHPHQGWLVKFKNQNMRHDFLSNKKFSAAKVVDVSWGSYAVVEDLDKKGLSLLQNDGAVEYVEPNLVFSLDPNEQLSGDDANQDASFSQQWGLKNTGLNSGSLFSMGVKGEDINALEAWKTSRGDRQVTVAVIDTGIDYNHSDLKSNMSANEAELNGTAGVDDDGNGYVDDVWGYDFANKDGDPMDGHGHGTHCAGVIGALHNRAGVMGVMGQVKIVAIKFLSDKGSGTLADAILAIDYGIKRGVNVMSNSWGGGGFTQSLKEAIERANDAGIVFVAAAGNDRSNNDQNASYPASYDVANVISVGAMNGKGQRASFSNYGAKTVHVFAPGENILSTVAGNGYKKMSGTSMATPFVSGAVGLLLARSPNLAPSDVRTKVLATAKKNGKLGGQCVSEGRLDAAALIR